MPWFSSAPAPDTDLNPAAPLLSAEHDDWLRHATWSNWSQWDPVNPLRESTVLEWKRLEILGLLWIMVGDPACIWSLWVEGKPDADDLIGAPALSLRAWLFRYVSQQISCVSKLVFLCVLDRYYLSSPPHLLPLFLCQALCSRILTFQRLPLARWFPVGIGQQEAPAGDERARNKVRVFIPLPPFLWGCWGLTSFLTKATAVFR